ncbi:MAG TPA: glycosyltransferase family 39 protein [Bacteroidales bacterium]|nr:glycosyltransferase family 39 protein [Bacteroidales bacterium]
MKSFLKNYGILCFLVLVKFGLQYIVVNPAYELHRDEFLHLDQAQHLAAGFQSVPPLSSWISVIINLLGGDIFWVRFFPALFGALTIVLAWLIVEKAGGGIHAKILTATSLIFSTLVRINILYQPNSLDILAWTIIYYCFIGYVQSGKGKWLITAGLIAGIGMLNKYNIVFLFAGLIPALLLTKHRVVFSKRSLYLALAIFIAIITPNLVWQIANNYPVLHHMKKLEESQLIHINRVDFILDQLKFFAGSLVVILFALVAFVRYKPFAELRFIGIAYVFTLTIFCLLRAKSYYAFGLYPVLIALGSVYLESLLFKGWKRYIIYALVLINILSFYPVYNVVVPRETPYQISSHPDKYKALGLLRWEDGKDHQLPQDFADMLGWREMAEKARLAYLSLPENEMDQTLIFTDNYGQVGALNYYNRGKTPAAYSFNTDYIFWIPEMPHIMNIILVGDRPDDRIIKQFESVTQFGKVENQFAREKGTEIWILRHANSSVTRHIYKMRTERIKRFDFY